MTKRFATEGIIAGASGAAVLAMWFLLYDLAQGQAFRTPALLGAVLFRGLRDPGALHITSTLVLEYSLVHGAAFALFGGAAAALLAAADREPRLLAALFMLFCCFEVAALAMIAVLGEWLFETLPRWSIVTGNLAATVGILGVLMRRHRVAWHAFLSTAE